MGGCVSSESNADLEQKKRSQMIDRKLEEDSRRLRRECKILLLGRSFGLAMWPVDTNLLFSPTSRFRRKWKIDHRQTNENHSPKWLQRRRTDNVPTDCLQEPARLCQSPYRGLRPFWYRADQSESAGLHHIHLGIQHRSRSFYTFRSESRRCSDVYMEWSVHGLGYGAPKWILLDGFSTIVCFIFILRFCQEPKLTTNSFFEHAKRIAAPDYIPNEADVLRARTKTTGIYETRFTMGQLSIQYDQMPLLFRPFSNLATACLMLVDSAVNERNGFIVSRMSHLSSFASHSANTTRSC